MGLGLNEGLGSARDMSKNVLQLWGHNRGCLGESADKAHVAWYKLKKREVSEAEHFFTLRKTRDIARFSSFIVCLVFAARLCLTLKSCSRHTLRQTLCLIGGRDHEADRSALNHVFGVRGQGTHMNYESACLWQYSDGHHGYKRFTPMKCSKCTNGL